MSDSFNDVFQQLNPAQRLAVETIEGPVMVVAGPGTGKTQVLSARIAHILKETDTDPRSILALTFTESAASNMQQRLVGMIGTAGYYVQIHTFHSFCHDVIQSYPEYFPIKRDSQPLSDLERYQILETALEMLELTTLRPLNSPFFYLKECLKAISDLKREAVSPERFLELSSAEEVWFEANQSDLKKTEVAQWQKKIAKNKDLHLIYSFYQQKVTESARFDFDDMIMMVLDAFRKNEVLLQTYQEQLLYILVDEYQDTNTAQNAVVRLLAEYWGDAANVFVVGDPNQSIYRFQGASLENVLSFTELYPAATLITLDIGYRSTQLLYDAAAHLIKENYTHENAELESELEKAATQALKSVRPEKQAIHLVQPTNQSLEVIYISLAIQKLIQSGSDPSSIAVLFRTNAEAGEVATALSKWSIPFEIDGAKNVLSQEHIRQLIVVCRVMNDILLARNPEHLYEVLLYDWIELDHGLVLQVARAAGKSKMSLLELIEAGFETFNEHQIGHFYTALEFTQLTTFIDSLKHLATASAQQTFSAWFETMLAETGFLKWVLDQNERIELLLALNALFREIRDLVQGNVGFSLPDFIAMLDTYQEHGLALESEGSVSGKGAVRLSTVHKAKGQEWEHVFVLRCLDGKWGNSRQKNSLPLPEGILQHSTITQKEQNDDDRRLFYVAMTRAKTSLTLTYPATMVIGNRSKSVIPSLFLEEIKPYTEEVNDDLTRALVEKPDEYLAQLITVPQPRNVSDAEKAFFGELISNFKLSVSALNTYLRSPEDFVKQYLLRVPQAETPSLAFGTAVHAAMELLFKEYQQNQKWISVNEVIQRFEVVMSKAELTESQLRERIRYGRDVLQRFYDYTVAQPANPLFIERFFGSGWNKVMLDDIALTGRIDRVDWSDQAAHEVSIIDYKTGQPKTMGEIEGSTVSSNLSAREQALPEGIRGPYKRQLLFYALLTQLDASFVPKVVQARFEFVEPDKTTGKQIVRAVEISQSEVEALKEVIKEVMSEIRSLAFLLPTT